MGRGGEESKVRGKSAGEKEAQLRGSLVKSGPREKFWA